MSGGVTKIQEQPGAGNHQCYAERLRVGVVAKTVNSRGSTGRIAEATIPLQEGRVKQDIFDSLYVISSVISILDASSERPVASALAEDSDGDLHSTTPRPTTQTPSATVHPIIVYVAAYSYWTYRTGLCWTLTSCIFFDLRTSTFPGVTPQAQRRGRTA